MTGREDRCNPFKSISKTVTEESADPSGHHGTSSNSQHRNQSPTAERSVLRLLHLAEETC